MIYSLYQKEERYFIMRDRLAVCEYYICKGECKKGRNAEQNGYCQKCGKYRPRKGSKAVVRDLKRKYKDKKYKERIKYE
jgi:hypothetical protein